MTLEAEFWKKKPLRDLSTEEWESLCDGCALCCLHKLEDEDTGELYLTNVACSYLDCGQARCTVYPQRTEYVAECIVLTRDNLEVLKWMPTSCTYRLVYEGKDLPSWHPLLDNMMHENQLTARDRAISEDRVADTDLEQYIICRIG